MTYPKITFTCTTFRRLKLFVYAMDSFISTCLDKDLICEWIVSDDGSLKSEFDFMQTMYPNVRFLRNPGKGQAANINYLWSHVQTEWFFHCEDDWLFSKKDNYIRKLFDVANEDEKIKNIVLRNWHPLEIKETKTGVKYGVHNYLPSSSAEEMRKSDTWWCGYSLNPGLQHKPTVDLLGKYDEASPVNKRMWDRQNAIAYYELGFKRGNLLDDYIKHLGDGQSAYYFRGGSM